MSDGRGQELLEHLTLIQQQLDRIADSVSEAVRRPALGEQAAARSEKSGKYQVCVWRRGKDDPDNAFFTTRALAKGYLDGRCLSDECTSAAVYDTSDPRHVALWTFPPHWDGHTWKK